MASIINNHGVLWISLYLNSKRYRKSLGLKDTPANRIKANGMVDKVVEKLRHGQLEVKGGVKSFRYYAQVYIKNKKHELRDSTYYKYNLIVNKAKVAFAQESIEEVKVSNLKDWINAMTVSAKTKREYLIVLKGIFDEAFYDRAIKENPVKYIKRPKVQKPHIEPFSHDEVNILLENAQGFLKSYLAIAFYTGMRSGEILGLKWEDLDFNSMQIYIRHTRSGFGEQRLKTDGSYRTIPISKILIPHIIEQARRTKLLDKQVFLNQYNRAYKDSSVINDHFWKNLLKDCSIAYRRIYNTRHTFATNMLISGDYSVMEVARWLGHTSIQMVIQNYAKFIPSENLKIVEKKDIYSHKKDIKSSKPPKVG